MFGNRKPSGTLLLAGLAAFAYYKYSKMSSEQKKDIVGTLKEKGRDLYNQFVPSNAKNSFANTGNRINNKVEELSDYTV